MLKNKRTAKALENLNKAEELSKNEQVRKDANEELAKFEILQAEAKGK